MLQSATWEGTEVRSHHQDGKLTKQVGRGKFPGSRGSLNRAGALEAAELPVVEGRLGDWLLLAFGEDRGHCLVKTSTSSEPKVFRFLSKWSSPPLSGLEKNPGTQDRYFIDFNIWSAFPLHIFLNHLSI